MISDRAILAAIRELGEYDAKSEPQSRFSEVLRIGLELIGAHCGVLLSASIDQDDRFALRAVRGGARLVGGLSSDELEVSPAEVIGKCLSPGPDVRSSDAIRLELEWGGETVGHLVAASFSGEPPDLTGLSPFLYASAAIVRATLMELQRTRAEQDHQQSAQDFRVLIESLPDGIVVHRGGRLVYINPAMCEIMGYEPSELLGRPVLDLVHPDDRDIVRARVSDIVRDGSLAPINRERLLRRDGSSTSLEILGIPVTFDGQESVLALARRPSPSRIPRGNPIESDRVKQCRILIVDDERRICETLEMMLAEHHEVEFFTSAEAACGALEGGASYDVLLFDISMPTMNGVALYEWLASHRPDLTKGVVFMTGGVVDGRCREFLQQSSVRCLEKPFDMSALERLIGELCC